MKKLEKPIHLNQLMKACQYLIQLIWHSQKVIQIREIFFADYFLYTDFAQVLLPNGQILYIGGRDLGGVKQSMSSILTYNIVTDSWQMMVWKTFFKIYQMTIDH